MARAPIAYDVASVKDWYLSLAKDAIKIAEEAYHHRKIENVPTLLNNYLNNSKLVKAFGATDSLPYPSKSDDFSLWYIAVLTRRCRYYLKYILNGLEAYSGRDNRSELNRLIKSLSNQIEILGKDFQRERPNHDTLLKSLRDEKHSVVNFLNSYIDPILFSALIQFVSLGRKYSSDLKGSQIYKEAGINDKDDFNKLRVLLMEVVMDEVSLYTSKGTKKSNLLMDDSTLWWAVYELLLFYDDKFYIYKFNKNLCGIPLASKFINNLIIWTKANLACPNYEMARYEATSEIHCKLRTQLLIIKNGIDLHILIESKGIKKDVLLSLKEFIDWNLASALSSWHDSDNKQLQKHAYFIGLALEVLCLYQSDFGDFEDDDDESYYARMWTNESSGKKIDKKQFAQLLGNKDTYDIFLIDRGDLQSRRVGRVYFRGTPVKKNLAPLSYQILVHTLKNKCNAGSDFDIAEQCWPDGHEFVDELKSERKRLQNKEIKKTDYFDSKPVRHLRKAVTDLNKVLDSDIYDIGATLRTFGQSKYKLSPIQEYCYLECYTEIND